MTPSSMADRWSRTSGPSPRWSQKVLKEPASTTVAPPCMRSMTRSRSFLWRGMVPSTSRMTGGWALIELGDGLVDRAGNLDRRGLGSDFVDQGWVDSFNKELSFDAKHQNVTAACVMCRDVCRRPRAPIDGSELGCVAIDHDDSIFSLKPCTLAVKNHEFCLIR